MPFCTSCGYQVGANSAFCRNCGAPQPGVPPSASAAPPPPGSQTWSVPPPHPGASTFLSGISDRAACMLCYVPVFGIVPAVVFLAAQRFRFNYRVRFNAFQGLYLFVAWLVVSSAFPALLAGWWDHSPERTLLDLLRLALICCWVYLFIKASQQQDVRLPVIGDLAARSTQEQL